MDYQVKTLTTSLPKTRCLVLPVYDDKKLDAIGTAANEAIEGQVTALIKRGDFSGKAKQALILPVLNNNKCERIILIGCGKKTEFNERSFRKAISAAYGAVKSIGATEATFALESLRIKGRDLPWLCRDAVQQIAQHHYQFNGYKSEAPSDTSWKKTTFLVTKEHVESVSNAVDQGKAIATGVNFAKDLGNTPPNICYPEYLTAQAKSLAKTYPSIKASALDEKAMEKLGMGSFLSVSKGSRREGQMITMEYHGGKKGEQPYVLVGKGITFDTGGISLKPGAAMDEMKYDMCGAASVFGTMRAVAELQLPINVVGVVASAENMPDGGATRPGDIVTSMSGKTIEILNTDAEGRLVLCDALTYVEKFKPKTVIDIATLTGACIVALGKHISGMIANNDKHAADLVNAGNKAFDHVWQLPMDEPYQEQLKSNFADITNIGGPAAGTITAGCFLSRFTEQYTWAHLDIAGTAWLSGDAKGATGRPVPLLTQYLIDRADS